MCIGHTEGESCGWPKGTVRATIALMTIPIGFLSLIAVMAVMIWKEQYTAALGITNGILGIVGTIVGYYFGSKQAEGAAKMVSKADHELIDAKNHEISLLEGTRGIRSRRRRSRPRPDSIDMSDDELTEVIVESN